MFSTISQKFTPQRTLPLGPGLNRPPTQAWEISARHKNEHTRIVALIEFRSHSGDALRRYKTVAEQSKSERHSDIGMPYGGFDDGTIIAVVAI